MNDLIIYQGREAGLGVIITQLSFLLACDRPVELWVSNENNLAAEIKRIWQIPDDRFSIRIGINPQAIPNIESDELCVYVDYFYSETLCLDQITPIKKSRKKHYVYVCKSILYYFVKVFFIFSCAAANYF